MRELNSTELSRVSGGSCILIANHEVSLWTCTPQLLNPPPVAVQTVASPTYQLR